MKGLYLKLFIHSCIRVQWTWQSHLCEGDVPSNETNIEVEEQIAPEVLNMHCGWWTWWWHITYAARLLQRKRRFYNYRLIIHQI
jgi:hypothetical protein